MAMEINDLLPTTVVGSYPQPEWLVDHGVMADNTVPRIRLAEMWRIPEPHLAEAQDDATVVAIEEMERAGIDIITDGEIRRESYSNFFGTALDGVDIDNPFIMTNRKGMQIPVPRIVGEIRRRAPVEAGNLAFLKRHATRRVKVTLPGPFTLSQQSKDEHYGDPEAVALAFAAAVNEEARQLDAMGVDVIQLDEPWVRNDPDAAKRYAVRSIDRALEGLSCQTAIHVCFGYARGARPKPSSYDFLAQLADCRAGQISVEAAQPNIDLAILESLPGKDIILGVLDLSTPEAETPDLVAQRIREGLEHVAAERLIPAPDCGMKYLSRRLAFEKLRALSEGAAIVRRSLQ
ncbi:5-methyltetrahydropteroyltriglutamate--homocysteine methyltransferase [Microbaculum marinum]|uniref:5-methyltetrahydropteroyltriglutamate--homocysteine methyltransferase n=1 Tax=Microbaculum marinum TaxID=1764581 RepID=A0AAW9RLT4_9HYPH